jgi:transcriptional regulator with XRE-family HTH domain
MNWMDAVKQWLATHERTQAWLARKAGMSDSQLNHYLAGRHKAGVKKVALLEKAMDLPAGTLTALRHQLELVSQEEEA